MKGIYEQVVEDYEAACARFQERTLPKLVECAKQIYLDEHVMKCPVCGGIRVEPFWFPLFEHMSREHGLTLTDSELTEIADKVDESRKKAAERIATAPVAAQSPDQKNHP